MSDRKSKRSIQIGGDNEGDIIQGKDNILDKSTYNINSSPDADELSDAIYSANYRTRWDERRGEFLDSESRKIKETVFISIVSAIAIGYFWEYTSQWSAQTVPFLIILITFFFNLIHLVQFGLRYSLSVVFLLSMGYVLLIKYAEFINSWMNFNQFIGIATLGTVGTLIGLFVGFILLFWKPLGD